jgi:hypothetical protein
MATRRKFDWNMVNEKIKELDKKPQSSHSEEDFYKPKLDEYGNGNVLMRFLPPHPDEDLPFVKKYNHGFQGPNGWFIEDCPTTIGKECPVCKFNQTIWNSDETRARNQKRKVNFFANVLIIRDPNCPENEGKVFKFRYGVKLHEKLMEKISPESDIDDPVQVFDYDRGANFKLKIKTQKIFLGGKERPVPNYDASSFAEPSPISLDGNALTDSELNELDGKIHRLKDLTDERNIKSYAELADLFFKKTGEKIDGTSIIQKVSNTSEAIAEAGNDFSKFNDDDSNTDLSVVDTSKPRSSKLDPSTEDESDADFFAKLRSQSE